MSVQSEEQLENELIQHLNTLGYRQVDVKDEKQLLINLKPRLNKPMDFLYFLKMNGDRFSII